MIVGLTGGSGAGKSSISRLFGNMGMYIIDADAVARQVMEPGEECLKETVLAFGEDILRADGSLDRSKLGNIVFHDAKSLEKLNTVTHKYITRRILSDIRAHKEQDVLIDGAVLIESGIHRVCDEIIGVLADKDVRIARIMARDGLSREQAQARIQAQKEDQFYIENTSFLIYNNGKELPVAQIREVMEQLKEREAIKRSIDS